MLTASGTAGEVPSRVSGTTSHRQHGLAAIFIVFLCSSFFLIQYDRFRSAEPVLETWYQLKVAGTLSIPDQYRIAVPFAAHFLKIHAGLAMRQGIPLLESLSYGTGLTALYLLLVTAPIFRAATRVERACMCGFFFVAVQLPVLWIFPWERPETLLTMGYLAVISLILAGRRIALTTACLLTVAVSCVQAFARTDAPMVVGMAALVAAAIGIRLPRPRRHMALLGGLCAASGALVQMYLVLRFPSTEAAQKAADFQLLTNFNPFVAPIHVPEFLTALLAFFVSLALIRRYRTPLDGADRLTLLIALLYLPIYVTFGLMSEVRIYVPYLFLLAPMFAKVWMQFLSGKPPAAEA